MIDINLIAARRAHRQRSHALMRLSFYSLFGLGIVIALMYAWMTIQINQVSGNITEADAVLSAPDMQEKLRHITFLKSQISDLAPKVQVLKKVHDSEIRWIEVLKSIGSNAPANVWVTTVSTRAQDKTQQMISLSGGTSSQRLVGAYMIALQHEQWCGPLLLVQARETTNLAPVEFEINIPLKEPIGVDLIKTESKDAPAPAGGTNDKSI